ncbi:MAG TPA: zf-HC2 domain-containing protein [Gemmatimonadota bacterium]|nr:zf-HC2 domain-containing protein [Gemmatimonadota bacterium]
MNVSEHLSEQRVYDLVDGRLDMAAESAAQAHLLRCERCRMLERECAGVVESLRWYGSEPVEAPAGYWAEFWDRWSARKAASDATPFDSSPIPLRTAPRRGGVRLAPVLAMAAALALLVGLWWTDRPAPGPTTTASVSAPPLREAMANAGWADDYARFERMSVAVGGIDPVSKGIVLASLAEQP